MKRRWLFADQLGPHFLDDPSLDEPDQPVLLIEARSVFARKRWHRRKAHLVLSALRHRAAELGDRCEFVQAATYREALPREPLTVCQPTSWKAEEFVRSLPDVEVLAARGYATDRETFEQWAGDQRGLLMENFYRDARRRLDLLMDGAEPAGGRWNFDADNREPPPKGVTRLAVTQPWVAEEDDIDAQVRDDLDRWERDGEVRFVGRDGPRWFAATRDEALDALDTFITHRLPAFGPQEDAMLAGDRTLAHSTLSAPMNLGLLDPLECARAAEDAYRAGDAPLAGVEGYIRQLVGWRDYIWHVYWHAGPGYRRRNALATRRKLPRWFAELDADAVEAACLSGVLAEVRDHGWVHHIPRLMVLSNYALQRGWDPAAVTDWFHRCFVDGYDWVMVPNVVGMSQHADGGLMATKPYASGGAYINRMSDYCRDCRYKPSSRAGDDACPFTAGYWTFLDRNRERLSHNHRMARPLAGLDRLDNLAEVVAQERKRGSSPP